MQILLINYNFVTEANQDLISWFSVGSIYLFNVIIALIMITDLIKLNIKGIPVIVLTAFSYFAGVVFFLFLINTKINKDERYGF